MIRGLPQPEWLSTDQALKLLQTLEAGLTMADLVSYCTELKLFVVYVRLRMVQGVISDDQTEVYGLGTYAVSNPEDLFYGSNSVTLHMHGDVFDAPDPQALKLRNMDWEYTTQKDKLRILFKRSELVQLLPTPSTADLSVPVMAPPPATHLIVISKLLELLRAGARLHTQTDIAKAVEEEFPHIQGLGETSLRTLFAAANEARKNVPARPTGAGPKIRLD